VTRASVADPGFELVLELGLVVPQICGLSVKKTLKNILCTEKRIFEKY